MKRFVLLALASASVCALATGAAAQTAATPAASAPDQATLGEIVVTARRRAESLQEVPQTVNAVTADTLQKLNITQFADIQTVVPGVSLQNFQNGQASAASLRGVTFNVTTASPLATVAFYVNDAPVQALFLFNQMFDIGQVEILRGPQGTTRGISAPSGAITLTTHKPDLSDFGGYVDASGSDLQNYNVQGAINVPIIKDVLAVRLAAFYDENTLDGTRSIHNRLRPSQKTSGERISVSFEPNDSFNANVAYTHVDRRIMAFDQVSGPGTVSPLPIYAGVNPPISPFQRAAVEDGISDSRNHLDLVTAQVDSRIFGQHLSYVGSYQHEGVGGRGLGTSNSDMGNILPGIEIYNALAVKTQWTTQEIRLASDPAPGRFLDYTAGAYYNWQETNGTTYLPGIFLPGAFGPTPAVNLAAFNPLYQVPVSIGLPSDEQETSLFGSVTLHLGANTELSGGVRHIWSQSGRDTIINVGDGVLSLPALGLPATLPCTLPPGFTSNPAPGNCTLLSAQTQHNASGEHETANIYNVSLSHHVTRDFMVYANTGTSFRPPFGSVGITGLAAPSANDIPELQSLTNHPAERSRSYEIGFKATLFDGRARLNADVFRQRFDNLTIFIPNVVYVSVTGPMTFPFTQSVPALVQGFELDTAVQVTRDWNISLQGSYADGKV
jgi:iron complex outermembrane receptor protein